MTAAHKAKLEADKGQLIWEIERYDQLRIEAAETGKFKIANNFAGYLKDLRDQLAKIEARLAPNPQ